MSFHYFFRVAAGVLTLAGLSLTQSGARAAEALDLVLEHGRVMDPASGLDAVRHVGIRAGRIAAISAEPLAARERIDATGLVVAPGFIDLHQHGQDEESYRFKALDGVTSALELEVGAADVDAWYREREGTLPLNHGVSIGHLKVRMAVMGDQPAFLPGADSRAARQPPTEADLAAMKAKLDEGLRQGAVAVGFGVAYTPSASAWEIVEMFRVAAKHRAPCHVHLRHTGHLEPGAVAGLEEVLAAAVVTGAPLHVVHIQSTGKRVTPQLLEMVAGARANGLDVSMECYPYTAGMTDIRAAFFNDGWRERFGLDYSDMQWGATGERLTEATFREHRKTGGLVIVHTNPEAIVRAAVAHPLTMIASDGLKGHPRNAGTYARILGHYVRETRAITLMDALRKIALLPAQRLEVRVPAMARKGRVAIGADADLTVFDPATVSDRATYTEAFRESVGIRHVLVNGVPVVRDGAFLATAKPGRAIRAP